MATTDSPNAQTARSRLGLIHYTDEGGERQLVNLSKDVFTIGRTRDNDLAIDNHLISRYHAEVIFDGRSYTYIDKRSRGGSFASQERISERRLHDGDTICLGSKGGGASLTFYFPELSTELESGSLPPPLTKEKALTTIHTEAAVSAFSLAALNQISRKLQLCASSAELVERLLNELSAMFSVEGLAVLLYHREGRELRLSGSRVKSGQTRLPEPQDEVIAHVCAQNTAMAGYDHQHSEFFLSVPLSSARQVRGACHLARHERAFNREEIEFLTAIGHQAGLLLETIYLLEEQRGTSESLIHALALSIDARDEMTAGHSARVASYAAAIARYLDLPLREQRLTYYAALLHDYGKIGIRDSVLCKPSQLTPDEYEKIKQHPLYTLKILSKINFGEEMAAIPFVASSHHERPDGRGYPRGLTREEIPIGARIIAVADFFDALTTERHYRKPMPLDEVLALIEAGRDSQFDGEVIDAFQRFFSEEYLPRHTRQRAVASD
jgi:HD-GYP domain-containing protein (c-di-GMP phosphodiesterase class II)